MVEELEEKQEVEGLSPEELEEINTPDYMDKFYKKALRNLKLAKNEFSDAYCELTGAGDNRFYQKNITETIYIDETWIKTLEGIIPNIDKIIKNPTRTIRYEEEITQIEKARKIDSSSVRHLASHSEYVQRIDPTNGNITPKKILTRYAEEELATYENRFIMTLIDRLYYFVKARYDIIKDNVESVQHDHLYYTSNFDFLCDESVEFKLDVDIRRDLDNPEINKHNIELFQRAERLMIQVTGFKGSKFMMDLAKAKKVSPPIMKTNVILKNADFRNAYTLWLFLDKYNSLAYDIHVRERPVRLSKEFKNNLDLISAFSYASLVNNKKKRQEDFRKIELVQPIVKKSTKQVKTNPKDMVKNPDAIEIQDNTVNEYYLLLNKKVMTQKIQDSIDRHTNEYQAAKKVAKESIEITNALFESYFEFEEDVDYFQRFIQEADLKKEYEKARDQSRIAKAIREAKEADLKKSIRLEKSLYKAMLQATNDRIKVLKFQKNQEAYEDVIKQIEKEIKQFNKEKKRIKDQIAKLDGKFTDLETGKTVREQELADLKTQYEAEAAKIKEEYKYKRFDANKEMLAKHNEEMKVLKDKLEEELKKAQEKRNEQLRKDKEKKKADLNKLREKEKKQLEKEKQELKEKNKKEKDKLKAEYDKKIKKALESERIVNIKDDFKEDNSNEEINEEPILDTPIDNTNNESINEPVVENNPDSENVNEEERE